MTDKVFVDSNIWIYGLAESSLEKDRLKRRLSLKIFENFLKKEAHICISIQVINECHWNFIRKFNIQDETAIKLIYENIVLISEIKDIVFSTYRLSNDIRQKYRLSFWDSLIIASALENNCLTLYSEDMQDGQIIEDRLKIINPFKGQGE